MADMLDVYETEIKAIGAVLEKLEQRKAVGSVDRGAWDAYAKEEFHKIGFEVNILWHYTNMAEVYIPEIEIVGRTDKRFEFDHDRQVHEITHDVLELGEGGFIDEDGKMKDPAKKVSLWTPPKKAA